jgi:hypothetical protein
LCAAAISLLMLATGVVAARDARGAAQSGSLATIQVRELPHEARQTLSRIEAGGPFPYRRDGRGYVVRLTGLAGLARRTPRNFAILLDVLEEAAQVWAAEGAASYVLLDDARPVPGEALPQVTAA